MDYKSFAFIMTAVEVETSAVKHCFDNWKRIKINGDDQRYYETELNRGSAKLRILTAQQNVMGMTAATLLAAKAVERFRPRYLIMSGIAAGADETADKLKRHHRRLSVSQCCIRIGCGFPPQSD